MQSIDEIYKHILNGNKYVNNMSSNGKIGREFISQNELINKNITLMSNNPYFPSEIKDYVINSKKNQINYKAKIEGREILIQFFTFDNPISNSPDPIIDSYAMSAFIILFLLGKYTSKSCSKFLTINLYLTHFNKKFPKKLSNIIDSINVNTGYSNIGCIEHSDVTIYRSEEWVKVLIHELFHNLNLDFSEVNIDSWRREFNSIFNIESKYCFYETYCEIWARIINVVFNCFIILQDRNEFAMSNFRNIFKNLINVEREYSIQMAHRIYKNIAHNKNIMEKTNVFCYYILVAFLFNNYSIFINWSKNNNTNLLRFRKTRKNINSFFELIIKEFINFQKNQDRGISYKKYRKLPEDSLRMTIIEEISQI